MIVATQMNRRVANDPRHFTLVAQNIDPPAPRRRGIRSTDPIQAQITAIVDVLDRVPDLVGMRLKHNHP